MLSWNIFGLHYNDFRELYRSWLTLKITNQIPGWYSKRLYVVQLQLLFTVGTGECPMCTNRGRNIGRYMGTPFGVPMRGENQLPPPKALLLGCPPKRHSAGENVRYHHLVRGKGIPPDKLGCFENKKTFPCYNEEREPYTYGLPNFLRLKR